MTNNPLAALNDIHLPEPIGWWPLALGWYVILILAGLAIVGLTYFTIQRVQHRRRQQALQQTLSAITGRYRTSPNSSELIAELSVYLRRLVITYYPDSATLSGQDWLQFLDQFVEQPNFSQGTGKLLLTAPYQRTAPDNCSALIQLIETASQKIITTKRRSPAC